MERYFYMPLSVFLSTHAIIHPMKQQEVISSYISFFTSRGHVQIPNSPLVPDNDPTTLFTSSGMQPLIPYLLGEPHPGGKRLVNVQNAFRAQDIDEVGDNRHTTFFRMLGNWSLGDYFKEEQLPWVFEFLTEVLGINRERLYVSVFDGNDKFAVYKNKQRHPLTQDTQSLSIWKELLKTNSYKRGEEGFHPEVKIYLYGVHKNWWSRAGTPDNMPSGELGGPDSEIFYDFGENLRIHENSPFQNTACHLNCDCGRFLEIGNSVFMQYRKIDKSSFEELPNKNVDFGGGLERLIMATQQQNDVFKTSLFAPIIESIEHDSYTYENYARPIRILVNHFTSSCFIAGSGVTPSNTEQGYILRRLLRRGVDALHSLGNPPVERIVEYIVSAYEATDPWLSEKYETIKLIILAEKQQYEQTLGRAKKYIEKKYAAKRESDELMGQKEITPEDAFVIYATHGLSPTQIESLGYTFDKKAFAEKMEAHQNLSRQGASGKFSGGLADQQERTIRGHTATHLLQQALRDVLGKHVHQTGSNITSKRLRFDFSHEGVLTDSEIAQVEEIVKRKIAENLPVHFEMLPLAQAKELGAIGLFDGKYHERVKVYFIGGSGKAGNHSAYSKEFCGGPHVHFTSEIKSFKIIKKEKIGTKQRRIYAVVE